MVIEKFYKFDDLSAEDITNGEVFMQLDKYFHDMVENIIGEYEFDPYEEKITDELKHLAIEYNVLFDDAGNIVGRI